MGKKKSAVSASTETLMDASLGGGKSLNYKINLKCKNKKQKDLVKSIEENDIIIVEGVFGVGKTFVINSVALEMLKRPESGINKISHFHLFLF